MRHGFRKAMIAGAGLCGLLAGCATTVDMGGPLGHYRYSYDSRPAIYDDAGTTTYHRYSYDDRYAFDEPRGGVTIYHHDDDDD